MRWDMLCPKLMYASMKHLPENHVLYIIYNEHAIKCWGQSSGNNGK